MDTSNIKIYAVGDLILDESEPIAQSTSTVTGRKSNLVVKVNRFDKMNNLAM